MTRSPSLSARLKRPVAASIVLALAGCQTAEPLKTAEICQRSDRAKPVMVGHVDERGVAYRGDAPKGEYDGVVRKVATALAVPRRAEFRRRTRSDCYDKAKDVWYPCVKEINVKFTGIKGIARAPKMGSAKATAVRLCEFEVRQASPTIDGWYRFESRDFKCRVIQEEYCPIFKATAEQKKTKEKLKEDRRRKAAKEQDRKYGPGDDCPSGATNCTLERDTRR